MDNDQQALPRRRGRPKGTRSVHFRQSLAIAYAFRGGVTRKEILESLRRAINPSNYNWLRTPLNYGVAVMDDPGNRDWLEGLYPARLHELDPGEHKEFHLARLRRLAAYN